MRTVAGTGHVVAASGRAGGAGKVVVVSTTHDPATPYQSGVNLARQLGAPLISYNGTQHTAVLNGNRCVDTAVTRYFVDGVSPGSLQC